MNFHEKIRKLRCSRGLSTKQAADILDIEECVYIAVENGGETLIKEDVKKLCSFYKISYKDFLNGNLKGRYVLRTK